ncbi:hypothetical protein [Nitrospina sp. P1_D6]|uniref:hypothetical protein n=1 Tax=Nitrospina sp. P1_D6 TaxID=3456076 RepID=UPI003F978A59
MDDLLLMLEIKRHQSAVSDPVGAACGNCEANRVADNFNSWSLTHSPYLYNKLRHPGQAKVIESIGSIGGVWN